MVKNHTNEKVTSNPNFETHYRNIYGEIVPHEGGDNSSVVFEPLQEKIISFILPKATNPQAYDVVAGLNYGQYFSNKIIVHYVLQGESATIQNVSLNHDSFKKGDTATLSLFLTPRADSFYGNRLGLERDTNFSQLVVEMRNDKGRSCIENFEKPLEHQGGTKIDVNLPIIKNCFNPVLSISIIDKNGQILNQKNFNFKSAQTNNQNLIFVLVLIFIIILLLITLKFKNKILPAIFLLVVVGLFSFANEARANSFYIPDADVTVYVDLGKEDYIPSESIWMTAYAERGVCSNSVGNVEINAIDDFGYNPSMNILDGDFLPGQNVTNTGEIVWSAPSVAGSYYVLFEAIATILTSPLTYKTGTYQFPYEVYAPTPATVTIEVAPGYPNPVDYNGPTRVRWYPQNATDCSCTYSGGSCGRGNNNDEWNYSSIFNITENTTFSVRCNP